MSDVFRPPFRVDTSPMADHGRAQLGGREGQPMANKAGMDAVLPLRTGSRLQAPSRQGHHTVAGQEVPVPRAPDLQRLSASPSASVLRAGT